jgi:hypothetical protein
MLINSEGRKSETATFIKNLGKMLSRESLAVISSMWLGFVYSFISFDQLNN